MTRYQYNCTSRNMSHNNVNNNIVRCPFNNNHILPRTTLQRHLVKCEKNYPPNYRIMCPYNATHRIGKDKIVEHIRTCPVKQNLESNFMELPVYDAATLDDTSSEIDCKNHYKAEMTKSFGNPIEHLESIEQTNGSIMDDLESQVNAMSIGRGRIRSNFNQNFNTKSVCTESRVNIKAAGRGRIIANSIRYYHRFRLNDRKNKSSYSS